MRKIENKVHRAMARIDTFMSCKTGAGYMETAIKVLGAVVIGALILYFLYKLYQKYIGPKVTGETKTLFDQSANASKDADDIVGIAS